MFHAISWSSYGATLSVALTIYYSVIGYRFYRKDLQALWSKIRRRADPSPRDTIAPASEAQENQVQKE